MTTTTTTATDYDDYDDYSQYLYKMALACWLVVVEGDQTKNNSGAAVLVARRG